MPQSLKPFDDWYVLETITPRIVAIGEPKYYQLNWSYLLIGEAAALLFDTGPGERNIKPVAAALTSLPLTVLPSHLHFDHVGNLKHFDRVAFAGLPLLRSFERDGMIEAPEDYVLGQYENRFWTPVRCSEWLPLGKPLDLGNLSLELWHTPGHSPESISLFCREDNVLLAADVLYPGPLYAQIPNADLAAYLETANRLAARIEDDTLILCGHGDTPETPAPRMARADLLDIAKALSLIRDGALAPQSRHPFSFPVNARMTLLASEASFGPWQRPASNI
jgi:glyoxylase-like metal-dependent hydrolase (beta-lactamase superfamily II)